MSANRLGSLSETKSRLRRQDSNKILLAISFSYFLFCFLSAPPIWQTFYWLFCQSESKNDGFQLLLYPANRFGGCRKNLLCDALKSLRQSLTIYQFRVEQFPLLGKFRICVSLR